MNSIKNHPRCEKNHPMVVRESEYGKFFGCLKYPNHQSVVNEPRCVNGHIMALRKNRSSGQEFFSCIKWKECKSETYSFEIKPKWYISNLHKEFDEELSQNFKKPVFETKNNFYKDYNKYIKKRSEGKKYLEELRKNLKAEEFRTKEIAEKKLNDQNDLIWEKKFEERFNTLGLEKNEIEEYHRLMNSGYGYNQLIKIADNNLKEYLGESILNRSKTTINQLKKSYGEVLTPQDKDWW